jgi:sugar/nucleoside kinase (ribokinase family)
MTSDSVIPLSGCPAIIIGSLFTAEVTSEGAVRAFGAKGGFVGAVAHALKVSGGQPTPIARLGMDSHGNGIADALRAAEITTASLQTDSDLATGRLVERGNSLRIEPYAAFDNLQWDADVEAAARSAELILTDAFGRRHGQTRSTIDRLLIAAPTAVRVIDLTYRPPAPLSGPDRLDREQVGQALDLCTTLVVDEVALRTLVPSATSRADGARRLHASLGASNAAGSCVVLVPSANDEGLVVTRGRADPTPRRSGRRMAGRDALIAGAAFLLGASPASLLSDEHLLGEAPTS